MEIFGNKMKTEGGAEITFNDMSLMPSFVQLSREFENKCSAFHDRLMEMGVKSYRCNDGWVDRENNIVNFFGENTRRFYWDGGKLKVGDKIFIGDACDGGRFAIVTDVLEDGPCFAREYRYKLSKETLDGSERSRIIEYNETGTCYMIK